MVKTSRRPGSKATGQCKAIAAKTCPFKHGQLHAQLVVIFNRFSYRAADNLPHHLSRSMSAPMQLRLRCQLSQQAKPGSDLMVGRRSNLLRSISCQMGLNRVLP
jgi:hypothetical protein